MGEDLTLEVHHIDGDIRNNTPTNVRFLCPTCHRLTPNFAGRSHGTHVLADGALSDSMDA